MRILKFIEQKDGGVIITIELNTREDTILRAVAKFQRKKYGETFLRKLFMKYINEAMANTLATTGGC